MTGIYPQTQIDELKRETAALRQQIKDNSSEAERLRTLVARMREDIDLISAELRRRRGGRPKKRAT